MFFCTARHFLQVVNFSKMVNNVLLNNKVYCIKWSHFTILAKSALTYKQRQ